MTAFLKVIQVSIPRSGFWVFKHVGGFLPCYAVNGFNPSVGILGVQAGPVSAEYGDLAEFQSLGRDSGCSSPILTGIGEGDIAVSIPRSGFWVFKRLYVPAVDVGDPRFNPSVGILGVQAAFVRSFVCSFGGFNPSVGILGVQASPVATAT